VLSRYYRPITFFIHDLNFKYNDKLFRREGLLLSSDKRKIIKYTVLVITDKDNRQTELYLLRNSCSNLKKKHTPYNRTILNRIFYLSKK
jgi:hypothetical protein